MKISKRRLEELKRIVLLTEEHLKKDDVSQEAQDAIENLKDALEANDVPGVVKLLNTPALMGEEGKKIFQSSDPSTDTISVDSSQGSTVKCGSLKPTQANIFISQSVAWPLSDVASAQACIAGDMTNTYAGKKGFLTINVAKAQGTEGGLVLDGHHRWSQTFAFNEDCVLPARVFDFGATPAAEALSKLHIAIRAELPAGEAMPSASDKMGKRMKEMGFDDNAVSKFKTGDNLLAAKTSQESMENGIYQCALYPRELKGGNPTVLSDDWCRQLFASNQKEIGCEGLDISELKPENELEAGNRESISTCPIRAAIIKRVAENLCAWTKDKASGAPMRKHMPQLDGGSLDPNGPDDISKALDSGSINVNPDYLEESHIINRWNKLAGTLLKD